MTPNPSKPAPSHRLRGGVLSQIRPAATQAQTSSRSARPAFRISVRCPTSRPSTCITSTSSEAVDMHVAATGQLSPACIAEKAAAAVTLARSSSTANDLRMWPAFGKGPKTAIITSQDASRVVASPSGSAWQDNFAAGRQWAWHPSQRLPLSQASKYADAVSQTVLMTAVCLGARMSCIVRCLAVSFVCGIHLDHKVISNRTERVDMALIVPKR